MRKKIAKFLCKWALKLCPEESISYDSRTLPEGYEVKEIKASHSFVLGEVRPGEKFRSIPGKEMMEAIREIVFHKLKIELWRTPEAWPLTANNGSKPGDLSVFTATIYVGINLRAKACKENRERAKLFYKQYRKD